MLIRYDRRGNVQEYSLHGGTAPQRRRFVVPRESPNLHPRHYRRSDHRLPHHLRHRPLLHPQEASQRRSAFLSIQRRTADEPIRRPARRHWTEWTTIRSHWRTDRSAPSTESSNCSSPAIIPRSRRRRLQHPTPQFLLRYSLPII